MRSLKDLMGGEPPNQGPRPLRVYLFTSQGCHDGGQWVENGAQLRTLFPRILEHMSNGLEVRITTPLDELAFHSRGRNIEWDGIGMEHQMYRDQVERQPVRDKGPEHDI